MCGQMKKATETALSKQPFGDFENVWSNKESNGNGIIETAILGFSEKRTSHILSLALICSTAYLL